MSDMEEEDEWMEDFLEEYIAGTKRYATTPNRPGKRPKGYKENPVGRLLKSKRSRLTPVTRSLKKKGGTRTSRAWEISPRRLRYPSLSKSRSRSVSRTPSVRSLSDVSMKSLASGKKVNFVSDAIPSKVRHKLTRKNARKTMPRGKPYARRSTKKPKGAYRGAVMPRWAKGETKHVLITDGHASHHSGQVSATTFDGSVNSVPGPATGIFKMHIGDIKTWSLNPVAQGLTREDRNGASVDGTYLRIQGHIHNTSHESSTPDYVSAGKQRAYVRMLALAVKGTSTGSNTRSTAMFNASNLFKKIDGSIVGFATVSGADNASDRVRTLQLPINKQNYTVLFDRKMELSGSAEGFGASDRLFDFKTKLKQKTSWGDAHPGNFEKNQIVFVVMTVDPAMDPNDIGTGTGENPARNEAIQMEFESKYSYKDF